MSKLRSQLGHSSIETTMLYLHIKLKNKIYEQLLIKSICYKNKNA